MLSYVVITHQGNTSTRTTEYHGTLKALKSRYTRALKDGRFDKVMILDGSDVAYFTWTRCAKDPKWDLKVEAKVPGQWHPA